MDITKIDTNFAINQVQVEGEKKYYTLPNENLDFYGGLTFDKELNYFTRIPAELVKRVSFGLETVNSNPSGGRVRFSTNSKEFTISMKYAEIYYMGHMPPSGASGFTLLEETDKKDYKYIKTFYPLEQDKQGFTYTIPLSSGRKVRNYILFLPLYQAFVQEIKLGFDKNSIVSHGKKYKFDLPVLYYGHSITQGGCASRPDNSYPALISKWNNVDFINIGFSGGAKGEEWIVEHIATIPSKVFVLDYDDNAPTKEHLEKTHYNVYETYRKNHPTTPIIMMSSSRYERNNRYYERAKVVESSYLKAKENGDKNIYFIHGKTLFAGKDKQNCTVDGIHPNDLGFYRMAKAVNKVLEPLLK